MASNSTVAELQDALGKNGFASRKSVTLGYVCVNTAQDAQYASKATAMALEKLEKLGLGLMHMTVAEIEALPPHLSLEKVLHWSEHDRGRGTCDVSNTPTSINPEIDKELL